MNAQIANCIQKVLEPKGVAVVIEAAHQCMTTRGVHKTGVTMVTSTMLGAFRDNSRHAARIPHHHRQSRQPRRPLGMSDARARSGQDADRLRHHQPRLQSGADRLRAGAAGKSRARAAAAPIDASGAEGQSVRHLRARWRWRLLCCRAIPMWCRWTARTGPAIPSSPKCATASCIGRGACDMKGFVGVALSLAPEIAQGQAEAPDPFRAVL